MAQKVPSCGVAGYGESPAERAAELGGGGERESEGGRRCSLRCCSIHGDREKSHTTCYNGARWKNYPWGGGFGRLIFHLSVVL